MLSTLVTERSVASILGISITTLQRMRKSGIGPQAIKMNQKRYVYKPEDVEAWINRRKQASF